MLIDTHSHIYLDHFQNDLNEVIQRAKEANVAQILMPNIDWNSLNRVKEVSADFPHICRPMIGLHPCSVNRNWKEELNKLFSSNDDSTFFAVGEIGIDLYWSKEFKNEQIAAFEQQINFALECDLPIVIHSRNAIDYTISLVQKYQSGRLQGVFHCFDQSLEHAQKIVELGFYLGIGGIITYKRNQELRDTLSQIPIENIVLETDSPYLPPVPYRGKRNESAFVAIVAESVANVYGLTLKEVADVTTKNAKKLFRI